MFVTVKNAGTSQCLIDLNFLVVSQNNQDHHRLTTTDSGTANSRVTGAQTQTHRHQTCTHRLGGMGQPVPSAVLVEVMELINSIKSSLQQFFSVHSISTEPSFQLQCANKDSFSFFVCNVLELNYSLNSQGHCWTLGFHKAFICLL